MCIVCLSIILSNLDQYTYSLIGCFYKFPHNLKEHTHDWACWFAISFLPEIILFLDFHELSFFPYTKLALFHVDVYK